MWAVGSPSRSAVGWPRRGRGRPVAALVVTLVVAAMSTGVGSAVPAAAANATDDPATADVAYGTDDPAQVLDVYLPPPPVAGNRPAVVLVHGGGWTGGDKASLAFAGQELARQGFVAFSIDYRVGGEPRWPTELEDVQQAVRWVQDHAADYRVDPTAVGMLGSSAGGNLAMLVGTSGAGDAHPPVRAVASWSGPSDLTTIAVTGEDGDELANPSTVPIPGAELPPGCAGDAACIGLLAPYYVQAYMGCTLEECPEQYRDASPVFAATPSTPPMFLAGAQTDLVPVEQNYEMANALTAARVVSWVQVVPGEQHADSYTSVALPPTVDFFTRFLVDRADPRVPAGTPPIVVQGSAPVPPTDAAGLYPTPPIPAAATPRQGVVGFVQRNSRRVALGGIVLLVGVLLVLLATRRARSARRRDAVGVGS